MFSRLTLLFAALLLLSACARREPAPPVVVAAASPAATTTRPAPTVTPTLTLTATAPAAPSATPMPTSPPTATATPEHPLMIEVMRRRDYPGSVMIIERTLEPGENYDRYIASYESDGYTIYGLVTRPFGPKPPTGFPVIIFNHGYIPPDEYRTTERYVDYIDYFARNGYMVFRPDYRGHGDSEGEASGAYGSPDYTVDVLNALAAVKTLPSADPNRIGMWGHSMGGFLTLRAMVIADDIRAGVIWGGVVGDYPDLFGRAAAQATADASALAAGGPAASESAAPSATPPPEFTRRPSRWRLGLLNAFGSPADNPAFWSSISANAYLADLSGPIQLHHALGDETVPAAASVHLASQMTAAGLPVELYLYDNDNHDLDNNFFTAMRRSLEFFDRYVKNAP